MDACEDLELAELPALSYYVVVGEHDCFGKTGCTGGEVEIAAGSLVGFTWRDSIRWNDRDILCFSIFDERLN